MCDDGLVPSTMRLGGFWVSDYSRATLLLTRARSDLSFIAGSLLADFRLACHDELPLTAFGLSKRYRTPDSYGTGNRILIALRNVIVRRLSALFDKLRKERGSPFINGQLDLWSSGLAKDAFGGLTASLLLEEEVEEEVDTATLSEAELKDYMRQSEKPTNQVLHLVMKSILLDFSSFPFKSHTAENIEAWLLSSIAKYGLSIEDFHLFAPDGANNGLKAMKLLKALYRVCAAHNVQMAAQHAGGNGSKVSPPARGPK